MTWTQPICDDCWDDQHPHASHDPSTAGDVECCAWCGRTTRSGIYTRADPSTLPYPKENG